jgi:hypothetical protein
MQRGILFAVVSFLSVLVGVDDVFRASFLLLLALLYRRIAYLVLH